MKKLSIIIPCYNVEAYLDRCFASLERQTIGMDALELIFVNDASPDQGINKLYAFEAKYPDSIIVINSEENLKQGGARNLGLQYASADYIGYVDPDDWVEDTMFEKLYEKAIQYNADIVTCECKRVFSEAEKLPPKGSKDAFYIIENPEMRRELYMLGLGSGGVWSKLYRKSFLTENKIVFPEHLSYEDNYFVSLVIMCVKRIYFLDEVLYYYFVNNNSTIVKSNSKHHFDRLTVSLLTYEQFEMRGYLTDYYREFEYHFLLCYYLNSIHTFLLRFEELPLSVIRKMNITVRMLFPTFLENPYLDNFTDFYKQLIKYLPYDLPDETWKSLQIAYQKKHNISFSTETQKQ